MNQDDVRQLTPEEEDKLCPKDKQPFFPLIYLGPEALAELYPSLVAVLENNFTGGKTEAELRTLVISTRAWLQHFGVFVE